MAVGIDVTLIPVTRDENGRLVLDTNPENQIRIGLPVRENKDGTSSKNKNTKPMRRSAIPGAAAGVDAGADDGVAKDSRPAAGAGHGAKRKAGRSHAWDPKRYHGELGSVRAITDIHKFWDGNMQGDQVLMRLSTLFAKNRSYFNTFRSWRRIMEAAVQWIIHDRLWNPVQKRWEKVDRTHRVGSPAIAYAKLVKREEQKKENLRLAAEALINSEGEE